jgi:uncharacterized protein (DUF58 family)
MPSGAYTQLDQLLQTRFVARGLSLFPKRRVRSSLAGNERTHFRGRGMDFEEVRLYQAGDDIRNIDWRVTARTQVTHTKVYREERERPVLILVDQRAPLFFGSRQCFKSVLAAEIAAILAWAALDRGDRIGGMVLGDQEQRDIKARRSKHSVLEFIHQIHDFNQKLTSPFGQTSAEIINPLINDARRIAKPGSAVFIISDFHDLNEKDNASIYQLTRHTDVTLLQVHDPLESSLISSNNLSVSNGSQQILLPTNDKKFQQAFHQGFVEKQEQLQNLCKSMGIALLNFSTADDLTISMQRYFSNAAHDPLLTSPLPGGGTVPSPGKGRAKVGSNDSREGIK